MALNPICSECLNECLFISSPSYIRFSPSLYPPLTHLSILYYNIIIIILNTIGQYERSIEVYDQIKQKLLADPAYGPEHEYSGMVNYATALVYQAQGELDTATDLMRE